MEINSDDVESVLCNVRRLLQDHPATRSSDRVLLHDYYLRHFGVEIPFVQMEHPATIIRLRRALQRQNRGLRGTIEIEEKRDAHAQSFRDRLGKSDNEITYNI